MRVMRHSFPRFAALVAILACCGCASGKHERKDAAVTPGPQRVGRVALVNEDLHFVLVDVGTLYVPQPGMALKSFSAGRETGILAVSAERREPFIVADIVRGEPKVGDDVEE